ncbi:GntR family transcriptional regulator [Nitratireductor sp. ZSWI3]|uniref:GntR family transcriptional regulator n=1 Tax=Nitratireductor sp. ZSWI3 TaxID=2966359 RepID=UPI0021506439|nr:GntR family transcriptional regulator [Nitratireductor sp. ZSWI3]MCR4264954.1 GntR family transcriptional regulator [Nitratireductor sp. ZSWI3]
MTALRRDIVSGVLAPDAPLRLMALSKRYDIGYTPLREALSRLEATGLVVLQPNRGYRVAPVSLTELEDLEQARSVVETALLEDAIACGDLAWESGIVAAHHKLTGAARALTREGRAIAYGAAAVPPPLTPPLKGEGDDRAHPLTSLPLEGRDRGWGSQAQPARKILGDCPAGEGNGVAAWMEAHDAFHQALLAAARSSWLKSFQRQVSEQLRRHHQALLFHPGMGKPTGEGGHDARTQELLRQALALDHHTQLMNAALARDTPSALNLMRAHVQFTLMVYRSVAAQGTPGEGGAHR